MKKFVFISVGFETPTPEIQKAWADWFASIGDKIVDSGNPLGPGKEVTKDGVKDLQKGKDAQTGYTIIKAENMEEAVAIAQTSPIMTSMRVYEAMSM